MHVERHLIDAGPRTWTRTAKRGALGVASGRVLTLAGRLTLLLERADAHKHERKWRRSCGADGLVSSPADPHRVPDPVERAGDPPAEAASSTHAEDAQLVRAALSGERDAVERFATRMRCIARILAALNFQSGRVLDEHTLADVAQDCALVVWRKLASFRPSYSLEGWVYGIVLRELLNARRRQGHVSRHATSLPEESEFPQLEQAPDESEYDETELEAALEELSEAEALVIRLRHYEDLSFPAIGVRLAVPENTAKTRYHRGLERLRELLHVRQRQREHRS